MVDIRQFLNIRAAYGPSFSADGRRLFFIATITGVPQVWTLPLAGGWPEQYTWYSERVGEVACAPAGEAVVFTMDTGGDEHMQLHLLAGGTDWTRPLTENPAAMHRLGRWSPDGRRIGYCANDRDPAQFDVWVLDVAGAARKCLVQGSPGGQWFAGPFSPDGRWLLLQRLQGLMAGDVFRVEVSTGRLEHLTPHPDDALFIPVGFAGNGADACVLSDAGREFRTLVRIDLATGQHQPLVELESDIDVAALSFSGRFVAWAANVGGYSELSVLDLTTGRRRLLSGLPPGVISALEWHGDSRLAIGLDGPRHPADIWLAELALSQRRPVPAVRQLTHSSRAGIQPEQLVAPQAVDYPTFDGRRIPAFLYMPAGAAPGDLTGVVVTVHGGPEAQERPNFNPVIQYLVRRGFGVLAPNVRGSTGYGRTFSELDDRRLRFDAVADLKHAHDWLVASGWAHPDRVAVMGGSYGGFMTLAAITTYPQLWAAAVDIVGIANLETFLERTHPFRRALREREYGSLSEDREWFRQVSPIHHVERIRCPLLVIHGANDPRVPVAEAEQIVGRLRELRRPVTYLRFEDEGHGVIKLQNQLTAYAALADFLERHLASGNPPIDGV